MEGLKPSLTSLESIISQCLQQCAELPSISLQLSSAQPEERMSTVDQQSQRVR